MVKLLFLIIFPALIIGQTYSHSNFSYAEDGMLVINGKRTFIIGSYHLPKTGNPFESLNKNGYNYVHVSPKQAQLDSAFKYNLFVWITTGLTTDYENKVIVSQVINKFKNHPALLCWEIADEPAWIWKSSQPRVTHDKMLETYKHIKKIDPEHLIYTNHAPANLVTTLQKYNTSTDIAAVDVYPVIPYGIIPTYALYSDGLQGDLLNIYISQVGEYIDKMKSVVENSKPVFAVLQGFAWEMLKKENLRDSSKILFPTYQQSRFMAYNAIVHGATGIIYWGTNYTPQPSQFMDDLYKVTKELNSMQNVLSAEGILNNITLTYHELGYSIDFGIEMILKQVNETYYLITTNSDRKPAKATFNILSGFTKVKVLSEDRILKITNKKFTDYYNAFDVHIYQLMK